MEILKRLRTLKAKKMHLIKEMILSSYFLDNKIHKKVSFSELFSVLV
jgi:hypothetical protein